MEPRRTIVKVCGLTRLEDARGAREAGADWLGFVLIGQSPRRVEPGEAARIVAAVGSVGTVAVMVSPTPAAALELARRAGVERVQLHGVDAAAWPDDFPLPASFSVPVAPDGSITEPLPPTRHLVLLDTAHERLAGGTGTPFPWETARVVAASRPVLLAGGLDADNVGAALACVHPYGVDASSRLESEPGVKDPLRVRRFVAAVRAYEARGNGR